MGLFNKLHAGDYECFRIDGEVVGTSQWAETHVSGSGGGGGGFVYNGTGSVGGTSVSISSTVTERGRFFIRTANGHERQIDVYDGELAVRDGHRVTAIYGRPKNAEIGYIVLLANHDTGKRADRKSGYEPIRGKPFSGWWIVAGFVLFFTPLAAVGLPLLIGSIPLRWFDVRRIKAIDAAIRSEAERELQDWKDQQRASTAVSEAVLPPLSQSPALDAAP